MLHYFTPHVNETPHYQLEGASGIAGSRMPLGGTPLDNIDLTNTKNWINQGAANN